MVVFRKLAGPKLVPELGAGHAEVLAGPAVEKFDAFLFW
jgi:hypothetical protein